MSLKVRQESYECVYLDIHYTKKDNPTDVLCERRALVKSPRWENEIIQIPSKRRNSIKQNKTILFENGEWKATNSEKMNYYTDNAKDLVESIVGNGTLIKVEKGTHYEQK